MKTSHNSPTSPASSQNPEQSPSRILFGNTPESWVMAMSAEEFEQLCFNISEAQEGRFVIPILKEHKVLTVLSSFAYYEPLAKGFVVHTLSKNRPARGHKLGSVNNKGYRTIYLAGLAHKLHHIVWLWFTGEWVTAPYEMDHHNKNKDDNSIENLRKVLPQQNARNRKRRADNKSGYTGVTYNYAVGKYLSRVTNLTHQRITIGWFLTAEEAQQARQDYISNHPELGYTEHHGK